jgi:hypothetical protein
MAMLEDVLVPVYLYHRYQVEAVTKWVGGMNYSYALRKDGQLVTKPLSKQEQLNALNAVLDCIDPKALMLPQKIVQLIPPRPAGYDFTRELFRKRTGLAFDALAPAETAADLPFSFLFNTERVNRMVENEVENGGLGLDEALTLIINKTWKAPRRTGMEGLIQMQTEQVLLTYLLALSADDKASFISRAVIQEKLNDLKILMEKNLKISTDNTYKGHLLLALDRMKKPEQAKPTIHVEIPPGAPIGSDDLDN